MFCTKCGQQSPDGAPFCTSCGAPLSGAAPVYAAAPPQGNPLVKRRNVTVGTRVLMMINAILGLLTVLMPLLPFLYEYKKLADMSYSARKRATSKGPATYYNIFTEKKTPLSISECLDNKGFEGLGILLMFVVILFSAAVIVGAVLAFMKFKWSGFIILCGVLYPFLYSFMIFAYAIGSVAGKATAYGFNIVAYWYFFLALGTIITSGLSLAKYRTKD